ncbi:DUF1223 domain-containing protein [Mucilaginibacter sp. UYCu711]|uniref:DUF1223 domain-containing protein n=1 Tax=Mucilaginibacter sp. UYCu711 TaxID=3156339 RepID=UPI003D1DC399
MRVFKISILTAAIAVFGFAAAAFISAKPYKANNTAGKGFAVIELFTSEGCSSCPPADELVSRIQKEYKDQPVYILAYHVDYWNRLGWRDVFSNAAYSARQYEYAKYLKTPQVYTPQIVVNGKKEFVGSEERTLRNAIKGSLKQDAPAQIILTALKVDGNKATLHYQTEGNGNNSVLLLALVQKNAVSNVKAGENSGRKLAHVQIIHELNSVVLTNGRGGMESINLPKEFNPQGWEVIALIQNTNTGEIVGATKAGFAPSA